MRVCAGRGAGRIRRYVTGAVNVVALDTAHERLQTHVNPALAGRSGVNAQKQGGRRVSVKGSQPLRNGSCRSGGPKQKQRECDVALKHK